VPLRPTSAPLIPGEIARLAAWLTATAAGLAFFAFLSRRAPQVEGPVLDYVPSPARAPEVGAPAPYRPTRRTGGEAQMPRWLRPSVQAARYADPGRDGLLAED
jgi:hypothetical protein